ncbi:unnamed protein product [Sphagnum balticum]
MMVCARAHHLMPSPGAMFVAALRKAGVDVDWSMMVSGTASTPPSDHPFPPVPNVPATHLVHPIPPPPKHELAGAPHYILNMPCETSTQVLKFCCDYICR